MAVALVRHGENGDWFASVGLQVSGSSTVSDMHICDRRIQVISKRDSHVVCRSWLLIRFHLFQPHLFVAPSDACNSQIWYTASLQVHAA